MQRPRLSESEAFDMACLIYDHLKGPAPRLTPDAQQSDLSPLGIYRLRDSQSLPILEMKLAQLQARCSRLQSNRRAAPA